MPFKLTKPQTTKYNLLIENARSSLDSLNQAITDYNESVPSAPTQTPLDSAEVHVAYQAYRDRIDELKSFAERLASQWRDDIDNRSDSWQDSDRGQAAEDFTSEWENFSPEPDGLDWDENPVPDYEGSEIDDFEALPESAN